PPPRYILRSYSSGMTTLFIFLDNDQIYSEDGCGLVISTSMCTLRPISAHNDELLYRSGEQTLSRTQGRDNKLHVWLRVEEPSGIGGSVALSESPVPVLRYPMDVDSLNYFR
ncbi:hypothetical protein EV421DRAFT_1698322, partial [Armillaria borealis]